MKEIYNLWCKIFGHKFIIKSKRFIGQNGAYETWHTEYIPQDFCVRCGTKNPNK